MKMHHGPYYYNGTVLQFYFNWDYILSLYSTEIRVQCICDQDTYKSYIMGIM